MDTAMILNSIDDVTFSRNDIQKQAEAIDPLFRKTKMRYLIGKMLHEGLIVRVSHGVYQRAVDQNKKALYANRYSDEAESIIRILEKQFPLLEYCVWELCWLNEFFNHQIAQNKIIIEVEHEGCEYVYDHLFDTYQGMILLHPSSDEVFRYGVDGTIIVDRLISEAPKGIQDKYNVPLEKVVVDLFANKMLQSMLSKADYPSALEEMFDKYQVNQTAMFRYARRRHKAEDIYKFLDTKTNIELLRKK